MDGDRPVVDGRDIFESKLQELVWGAFCEGWTFGDEDLPDPECCGYAETTEAHERYNKRIHELLISYLDEPSSDAGTQDEAFEEGEIGDSVQSEPRIDSSESFRYTFKEFDPIPKGYLHQLMTKKPYKFEISKDGKAVFKLWNLPQNLK